MSFSEEWKWELFEEEKPHAPCCRRAFALGLVFPSVGTDGFFRIRLPEERLGRAVQKDLTRQWNCAVEAETFFVSGRRTTELTWFQPSLQNAKARALISDLPPEKTLELNCENCTRYFLRGLFIAAGTMSDPQKEHHIELALVAAADADRVRHLLDGIGCPPKTVLRGKHPHLYYKNSAVMEDLLSYLHAPRTLFALINTKIERDIRNQENRATNCVAKNIQKAVTVAAEQTAWLTRLRAAPAWDRLPPALRETAVLRLENEDMTLSELAAAHTPPLTKSGLHHRLDKLTALAKEAAESRKDD